MRYDKNPTLVKICHVLFRFYYKRVPTFFHQWTPLYSLRLLTENYKRMEREERLYDQQKSELLAKNAEQERLLLQWGFDKKKWDRETAFKVYAMFGVELPNDANN